MQRNLDGYLESLSSEYSNLVPLLEYVRARIELDFSRLVRKSKLEGKVFFSTRIKTFESLINKISRKGLDLERIPDLLTLIISKEFDIKDIVGIRLVCFDERVIKELIQYIRTNRSLKFSPQECYMSSISVANSPNLEIFLRASEFNVKYLDSPNENPPDGNSISPRKRGLKRYEDINFYLYFQNIRDYKARNSAT